MLSGQFCDFQELFCVAGSGLLNDRFGRLIYADRHDNLLGPGDFLVSFWTNPSKLCKRTGVSRRRFGFRPPEIKRCVSGLSWVLTQNRGFGSKITMAGDLY